MPTLPNPLPRTVRLDPGEYEVTAPLVAPHGTGFSMFGAAVGPGHRDPAGTGQSSLVWRGDNDAAGPMLTLTGAAYQVGNLAFSGRKNQKEPVQPNLVGIAVHRGRQGIGTGKMHFAPLSFAGMKTAIQIGQDGGDSNCDLISSDWLQVESCQHILEVRNDMGMSQHLSNVISRYVSHPFIYHAGGDLKVDKFFSAAPCDVLSLVGSGPGPNNGRFEINGVKLDKNNGSGTKLLEAMDIVDGKLVPVAHEADCYFNGGTFSVGVNYPADNAYAWHVVGPATAVIRDWKNLQRGMVKMTPMQRKDGTWMYPSLAVENCKIHGFKDMLDIIHPDSLPHLERCNVETRGNRDRGGKRMREVVQ